jgi:hypothetical protein
MPGAVGEGISNFKSQHYRKISTAALTLLALAATLIAVAGTGDE